MTTGLLRRALVVLMATTALCLGVPHRFRYGGKLQTAGLGEGLFGEHRGTVPVRLTRAAARAVRAEGSVDALARIRSIDDAGQERVRWERIALTG